MTADEIKAACERIWQANVVAPGAFCCWITPAEAKGLGGEFHGGYYKGPDGELWRRRVPGKQAPKPKRPKHP
jgi:hypothetical protein